MSILVSVIMPFYNASDSISRSISSVIDQDYVNIELIVIDDQSTDSSSEIVNSFVAKDNRITLIKNSGKKGVSYARNLGISHSSGKYICFLDADDYMFPTSITCRLNYAQEFDLSLVFGSYERQYSDGTVSKVNAKNKVSFNDMLHRNYIGNLTGFYNVEKLGKINQRNVRHEDYIMWCDLLRNASFAYSVPSTILGRYNVSDKSLSGNKVKAFYWHWLALRNGLNLSWLQAFYYQGYYLIASVLDRFFANRVE